MTQGLISIMHSEERNYVENKLLRKSIFSVFDLFTGVE